MNEKLMAAVLAAVQAYMREEQAATPTQPGKAARWLRQGRLDAMKAGMACFNRPRRWR